MVARSIEPNTRRSVDKADAADDEEGGEHHVGIEEFLGVENHPAQSPIRAGQHFRTNHRDPGPQERLPQTGDDERRSTGNDDFPEQRALVGAHGAGGAQPDRIDRAHPGPGVEQHRKQRGVKDDQDRYRIAEAEPQDEDRHPGERWYRHQRAGQWQHEMFNRPKPAHRHAQRQADRDGKGEADDHAIERRGGMMQHAAVENRIEKGLCDCTERWHQCRGEIAAARDRLITRRHHDEREHSAPQRAYAVRAHVIMPQRTTVKSSIG